MDGFAADPAKPAADSDDSKRAGRVGSQADSQQHHQQLAAAAEGLLSQQLRQTAARQQQQQQQEESLCQQVTDVSLHSQAAAAAAGPEPDGDLTEDAEEQLMLRNAAAPSSSSAEAIAGVAAGEGTTFGPCHLGLPLDDPGNLGIWQLGAGAAAAGAGSSQQPHMLLAQRKGPDRPHRGQCMAVVLLQPQVSLAWYNFGWRLQLSLAQIARTPAVPPPAKCRQQSQWCAF